MGKKQLDSLQKEKSNALQEDSLHSNNLLHRGFVNLMIVPNLRNYKAIKDTLNQNTNYKVVINAISKSLEDKGYSVKDFIEALKIGEEKYKMHTGILRDPFQLILENAPSDIFVYVDIFLDSFKEERQISIQLTAIDKYNANRYVSTSLLSSNKRRSNNIHLLSLEALSVNNALDVFVEKLDQKLILLIEKGREVDIQIESKTFSLNQPLESGTTLTNLIINWVKENSIKKRVKGSGNNFLRIEGNFNILDHNNNRFLSPTEYGLQLKAYLENVYFYENANIDLKVIGSRIKLSFIEVK